MRASYNDWLASGDKEFTPAGNMTAPEKKTLVNWVVESWNDLDMDVIKKSFRACGLSFETEDEIDSIVCLRGDDNYQARQLLMRGCEMTQYASSTSASGEPSLSLFDEEDDEVVEIV
jgi:hypothetical protein